MLPITELAHQRNPKAIAEIIRQELQVLGVNYFDIEVTIIDSNLELQIHTNSSIDKEKILTLVHSKLHNLHIESVAKFRVYCWRKDEETDEQQLLWTEQFMVESLKLSLPHALELPSDNLSDPEPQLSEVKPTDTQSTEQSTETQLSKNSVLQRAINKLSSNNPKAKIYLQSTEQDESISNSKTSSSNEISPPQKGEIQLSSQSNNTSTSENWQLFLVGLSIVLLGLGIGAFTRAVTNKVSTDSNATISANAPIDKSSNLNPQNAKNQSDEPLVTPKSTPTASKKSRSSSPDEIGLTSPNVSETTSPSNVNINPSSSVSQEEGKTITLERFNRVQKGMTVEQVEKIFGVSGKVIAENTMNDIVGKVYSWKNPQGSNAIIEFKNGQVVAKAQAGL